MQSVWWMSTVSLVRGALGDDQRADGVVSAARRSRRRIASRPHGQPVLSPATARLSQRLGVILTTALPLPVKV